jgi:polyisoprenoid-binding protein YceI
MSYFAIAALILMSIAGGVLHYKKQQRFKAFVHLLFYCLIGLIALPHLEGGAPNIVFGVISMLSVNFLLGTFLPKAMKKPFVRLIFPILSAVGLILYFKGITGSVFGLEYLIVNKFLVAGAVLMLFTLDVGELKLKAFDKYIGGFSEKRLMKAFTVFMLAIGAFLGIFSSSLIGLYILGGLYLSTLFFRKSDHFYLSTTFLGVLGSGIVLGNADVNSLDILEGDALMGLFFGAFVLYFLQLISNARNKAVPAHLIAYFIPLGLGLFLLVLGTQYERMGGMDALGAMIIGLAVANAIIGRGYLGMSVLGWLLAIGLIAPKYLVNEEATEFEQRMISVSNVNDTSNASEDTQESSVDALELTELTGSNNFIADSSRVSFVLGAKKETKGAFKKVSGKIKIGETIEDSRIKVSMKLEDLTTFNQFRDESLLGEEYFSADKFPVMTYEADKIEVAGDNEYLLKGAFKMLGVKKPIDVVLQLVEQNGSKFLIGSGVIDRREFGMTPSATEGNVVEFTYQVMLNQK